MLFVNGQVLRWYEKYHLSERYKIDFDKLTCREIEATLYFEHAVKELNRRTNRRETSER